MSEMKHTPGPWAFDLESGLVKTKDGDDIGAILDDDDGALVAAAPDLLAALRELHTYFDFEEKFGPHESVEFADPSGVNDAMARAYAAIAKAEGREP